jgi:hypothetical protein
VSGSLDERGRKVKKVLAIAALAVGVLALAPAAGASTLSTTQTKLPGKVRLNSTFKIEAPQCVKDEWGDYPYACTEADLVFRVWRKHPSGWRRVYSDSTLVWTNSFSSLSGSDITRIYNWEYRGFSYYSGLLRNRKHKVTTQLVDNFGSTANPVRTRYFWAKYRAAR